MDADVRAALDALLAALTAFRGRRPICLHLTYSDGTFDLLSLPPACPTPVPPDGPAARDQTRRPAVEQAILSALEGSDQPLKGSAVAARCRRAYTSYFREVLSRLVAEGAVVRDRETGGYRLP